jgi:hypothetical protein
VTKLDMSIPEPGAEPAKTGAGAGTAPAPAAAASPEAAAKAKTLIGKAVDAFGGAAKVDALTSVQEKGTAVVKTPQGELEVKNSVTIALPDKLRQELVLPMGTVAMVLSPSASFLQTPGGAQPMPESEKASLKKEFVHSPLFLLRNRAAAEFKAAATGAGKAGDTPVEQVRVEFGGETLTLGIDPATGRVLTVSYRGQGPAGGPPGDVVQNFSDFRPVDGGLTLPFKMIGTFNGEQAMTSTTDSITLNAPIDAALFQQPAAPSRP